MKCDISSIKVLDDAVALVRQRPEMFVGVGEVQSEFRATSLAHDALALGVRQVEIHHIDEWGSLSVRRIGSRITMELAYGKPSTEFCQFPAA